MLADWGERSPRWAGVRSASVDVRGTDVHVLRADGPSGGTPMLLVHGLGGSATNWLDVMRGLASLGPVLAPDLPGFGRTEPPAPGATRIGGNARFLRALLHAVGWDRVVVVGNSMGGTISLLLAERAPEHVARLVLVSPALPAPLTALPQLPRATFLRFAPFLVPGLGRAVLRRMWSRMTPEEIWEEGAAFVHGDPDRVSPEMRAVGIDNLHVGRESGWRLPGFVAAAESVVSAVTTARPLLRAVDAVAAPTLVVWGDADPIIGRPVVDGVARRRPDWDLEVLEGVGHVPQIEVPRTFVEVVTGWLAGRSAHGSDDGGREVEVPA